MVATMTVQHTHLKTYRLALIADAHARAVERRISRGEIDMAEITDLSETQMGILDKGMRYETFALTRAEAGKAAGNLKTRGLIKKTSIQGRWTMTDQGRAEHGRIMAALTAAADITIEGLAPSPINMDDPALAAKDPVLQRWMTLADERVRIIEARDSTIESLRREIGALKEKLLGIQPTRADVYLAGQILDELCEMIPEVEEFRLARESAVKAISILKAKR